MKNLVYSALLLSVLACGSKNTETTKAPSNPDVKPVATAPAATAPVASAPATPASTPAAELPKAEGAVQALYDHRTKPPKAEIPTDERDKVLGLVFGKYKKSRKDCVKPDPGAKTSDEDIAAGQIAPEILSSTKGFFLSPTEELTAYSIDVGECNAEETRDTPDTTPLFVLIGGGQIKLKGSIGHYNRLKGVDLDQDGKQELVALAEFEDVESTEQISLYRFVGDKVELLPNAEYIVFTDSCEIAEAGGDEGGIRLTALSFTPVKPGEAPSIKEEKLMATCKKDAPFVPFKE